MDPFKLWHDKDEQFVRRYALGLGARYPRNQPRRFELTLQEVSRFEDQAPRPGIFRPGLR